MCINLTVGRVRSRRSGMHRRLERGFVPVPRGPRPPQQRYTNVDRGPVQVFHIRADDVPETTQRLRRFRGRRVQGCSIRRRYVQRAVQPTRRIQDYDTEERYL